MKDFIRQKIREGLITENRVKMNVPIPSDIMEIKDVFVKNGFDVSAGDSPLGLCEGMFFGDVCCLCICVCHII